HARRWMRSGGYQSIAKLVFRRPPSVRTLPPGVRHVARGRDRASRCASCPRTSTSTLGLVSTKSDEIEDKDALVARIDEGQAAFVPRDQFGVSTQCGFAAVTEGNPISPGVRERKLKLVVDVANRAVTVPMLVRNSHVNWLLKIG